MADSSGKTIQHIIDVQSAPEGLYLLLTTYPESNALAAVGQLLRTSRTSPRVTETVLNTNDALSCLWRSPSGAYWLGSADGNVWTTAGVNWEVERIRKLEYDEVDRKFHWSVIRLPDLSVKKFRPNVTDIWGVSDNDVHVATFEGAIYHWNGTEWKEKPTGVTACLNELHGSGPEDVYCVGYEGTILHYNGTEWTRLPFPGDAQKVSVLTGVRALNPSLAAISERQGRIFAGNSFSFRQAAIADMKFYGLSWFNNRLFLAAGENGVWEIVSGNPMTQVKSNFAAVNTIEGDGEVYFIEPAQSQPRIILHQPSHENPWVAVAI